MRQLKKLRGGRGATVAKLKNSWLVLEALGTSDPVDAQSKLRDLVLGLGTDRKAQALRVAFAIDMKDPGMLTQRRHDFAMHVRKSADAVQDWEDLMLQELVLLLASGKPAVENFSAVEVYGVANGKGLYRIDVVQRRLDGSAVQPEPTLLDHGPSFLIYRLPETVTADMMLVGVRFEAGAAPATAAVSMSTDATEVLTSAGEQIELKRYKDGTTSVGKVLLRPDSGTYYCVSWR